MKSWQTWLNILLVLAIALMILFWPSKPQPERITQLETADKANQVKIDSVHRVNQSLLNDLEKQILRREADSASFVKRLNAKQDRQEKIKPIVLQQTDSLPIVREYILRQDSIVTDLSARVQSLEFEVVSTTKTLKGITESFETELKFTQDQYKIALEEAEVYRKGWRKEQRKTKVWKVAAVCLGVGGLLAGSAL